MPAGRPDGAGGTWAAESLEHTASGRRRRCWTGGRWEHKREITVLGVGVGVGVGIGLSTRGGAKQRRAFEKGRKKKENRPHTGCQWRRLGRPDGIKQSGAHRLEGH